MRSPSRALALVAVGVGALIAVAGAVALATGVAAAVNERGKPPARAVPPFSDYTTEHPGASRKITVRDLPEPYATKSVDNGPHLVPRPPTAWPKAPAGFAIGLYATGLENPRLIRVAPNGDAFVAESRPGQVRVLRGLGQGGKNDGKAETSSVFARGLNKPFGIAFFPPGPAPAWIYVANTDSVVRYRYRAGDLRASGAPETIVAELPGGGLLRGGGHWTRDLAFSLDGKTMFVSVGSRSNNDNPDDHPAEFHRADILEFTPTGGPARIFAAGIRNAVGIAIHPTTGELWASVNERDTLGDDLVPDYITHVERGGFYGWPWFYIGGHPDPRHLGLHPELADKVIVPDVLLQPHFASLEMVFYDGKQFPAAYRGDVFAAEHGSWNKAIRTGYSVIRVPMRGAGRARGDYEDFVTGFVTPTGDVWGRPVGVAVASDGALLVTDDGTDSVWRVSAAPGGGAGK